MQQFYFIILNPSRSLPLSIPEAACGGGGGCKPPLESQVPHMVRS